MAGKEVLTPTQRQILATLSTTRGWSPKKIKERAGFSKYKNIRGTLAVLKRKGLIYSTGMLNNIKYFLTE